VRIWVRDEANILADAPSRAPWEAALAKHLPIPDLPVRELVRKMYQEPKALKDLVSQRRSVLTGEAEWTPLVHDEVRGPAAQEGYVTPNFGEIEASGLACELGRGRVLLESGPVWPSWPTFVSTKESVERFLVALEEPRAYPVDIRHLPSFLEYRTDGPRTHHFVVRWKEPVMFTDGKVRKTVFFNAEPDDEAARRAAWTYFAQCMERAIPIKLRASYKGRAPRPALSDDGEGLHFHGVKVGENYEFVVYPGPKDFEMPLKVARWDYRCDTFDPPALFCGDFDLVGTVSPGIRKYRCRGHVVSPSGRIDGAPLPPPLEEPDAVVHGEPRLHAPPGAEAVVADRGELPAALPVVGGHVPSITIRGEKVSGVAEQRSLVLARREAGWQKFMGRQALMVSGATRFCIPSPALSEVEFPYRTTFVFVEREGVGTFWVALERRRRYVDLPDKTSELGFRAQWMLVVFFSKGEPVGALEAFEPGNVEIDAPVVELTDRSCVDFWEPVPSKRAWVRYHVVPRRTRFVPVNVRQGPEVESLGQWRYTYIVFDDGTYDVRREDWTREGPRPKTEQSWTGETWFFEQGQDPGSAPPRRAYRVKQPPKAEVPEPEALKGLRTGGDETREALVALLGGMKFER